MGFDFTKNIGLGLLLIILLLLVLLDFQYSQDSAARLRQIIETHEPMREHVFQLYELLNQAKDSFLAYKANDNMTSQDIIEILETLKNRLHALDQQGRMADIPTFLQLHHVDNLLALFRSYIRNESLGHVDTEPSLINQKQASISQMRVELVSLREAASAANAPPHLQTFIKACQNFLEVGRQKLQDYVVQEHIDIKQVIVPIDEAIELLGKLQSTLLELEPLEPWSPLHRHLQAITTLIPQYKSAVLLYDDEILLGVSGSDLEEISTTTTHIQQQAVRALIALNREFRQIQHNLYRDDLLAEAHNQQMLIVIACVGMGLAVAVSIILSHTLTHRISQLIAGVRRFSRGDLEYRLSDNTNDRLSELAVAFNQMAAELEKQELERQQHEQKLALIHAERQASLNRLTQAYQDLQRSQENLIQAEKMAAIGRLTAGIAHEMNTPLGASLTAFKLLQELVEEYKVSIGSHDVTPQDHQEIAAEMDHLVQTSWH